MSQVMGDELLPLHGTALGALRHLLLTSTCSLPVARGPDLPVQSKGVTAPCPLHQRPRHGPAPGPPASCLLGVKGQGVRGGGLAHIRKARCLPGVHMGVTSVAQGRA